LEKYRINFLDEVEEGLLMYEATLATLEDMSAEARRFITEGMTEVADAVKIAWNMDAGCQDEFDLAQDPPKYNALVQAYAVAVRDAIVIFEDALEELNRREREKVERAELQGILDDLPDIIKETLKQLAMSIEFGFEQGVEVKQKLAEMESEIFGLGYSKMDITEWRKKVESVRDRVGKTCTTAKNDMLQAGAKRKNDFKNKFQVFNAVKPTKASGVAITAEDFIKHEGVEHHEEALLKVKDIFEKMHKADVKKEKLQLCLRRFMNDIYGDAGLTGFRRPSMVL